ncbi:MAG: protein translocase subunit SecD [Gammaproteobacteria bacterium]|nr:protein translocase subunit SecD [Gammaproteobacteria bacterium]
MLNQYSISKYLMILGVLLVGLLYAAPNLYGEDPSVQVSVRREALREGFEERINQLLTDADLKPKAVEISDNLYLGRLSSLDEQARAVDLLRDALGDDDYIVSPNLAPATPDWLRNLNALPMYLGLDLRGGVHFLLQVDMNTATQQKLEGLQEGLRQFLRENKMHYSGISINNKGLLLRFKEMAVRDAAYEEIHSQYAELELETADAEDSYTISGTLRPTVLEEERKNALSQNISTLRNRVNELGVAEPVIQRQGSDRIVVQLPGVQDTTKAKEILASTATLEYRLVHGTRSDWIAAESNGRVPVDARLYHERNGSPVLLKRSIIVKGDNVVNATSGYDSQNNLPAVFVTLDGKGSSRMSKISGDNIGNLMAVVYIETKVDITEVNGEQKSVTRKKEEVISVATIRDQLSKRFQTTGLEAQEARDLALLLRAGSLSAPMTIIEERTVGPSLGKDNIDKGLLSVQVGVLMVMLFMLFYYRTFGFIADIALTANIVLIVAVLSMLQATLTMPGIAGIVLTVGMAVDANVLIFERIREELRNGNSVQASIHSGYEKAFSTIADANITTLIAAVVLFSFGTGPIKGFAVTLSIGIVTSLFTAIMVTRAIVNLLYGARRVNKLSI